MSNEVNQMTLEIDRCIEQVEGNSDVLCPGVLDCIDQQFSHSPKKKSTNVLTQGFGGTVIFKKSCDVMFLLYLFSKPFLYG